MTGMLGSLDDGIANVTAALQAKGMLDEAVFIVTADVRLPACQRARDFLRSLSLTLA